MIGSIKSWYEFLMEKPKSRDQYVAQSLLAGISPIHNGIYNYRDNMAYMDDYMKNRGFDYDYIRYPSRTVGWLGGVSLGHGIKSVSSNVARLYK